MDYVVRGANILLSDATNTYNLWQVADELQVPDLKRAMDQFTAGGHMMGVEFPEEFAPLTSHFKLKTDDPRIRQFCGHEPGHYDTLTHYENLTSFRNGNNSGRVITIRGLLNEVKADKRKGLKTAMTEYVFSTIVFYQDMVGGQLVHQFDYFGGPGATVVGGVNPFAAMAANLAIGGGTVL